MYLNNTVRKIHSLNAAVSLHSSPHCWSKTNHLELVTASKASGLITAGGGCLMFDHIYTTGSFSQANLIG